MLDSPPKKLWSAWPMGYVGLIGLFFAVWLTLYVLGVVSVPPGGRSGEADRPDDPLAWPCILFITIISAAALWISTARVAIDEHAIDYHGLLRRRRIAWSDVRRVNARAMTLYTDSKPLGLGFCLFGTGSLAAYLEAEARRRSIEVVNRFGSR